MTQFARMIAVLGIACSSWACRQTTGNGGSEAAAPDSGKLTSVLDRLDSLGFYKYASAEAKSGARAEALRTGFLFGDEAVGRVYHADAEALAEGGVGAFLRAIGAALEIRGVKDLSVTENPAGEDGAYRVSINGQAYEMYSGAELQTGDIWQLTTERAFSAVNQLLADAGSDERLYWLYGGNDNLAVFLTQAQHRAIVNSGLLDTREIPAPVGLPAE